MSAYLNALREEGTREDLLREIERLIDQRDDAFDLLREVVGPGLPLAMDAEFPGWRDHVREFLAAFNALTLTNTHAFRRADCGQ